LAKGEEMGRFKLGSTIVVITPKNFAAYDTTLTAGSTVRMGAAIGNISN
jgi:phosphatidylserine decarboxylase